MPSVYFIAVNGSPIEVTAGYVEPNAFCQIIQSVIKVGLTQFLDIFIT